MSDETGWLQIRYTIDSIVEEPIRGLRAEDRAIEVEPADLTVRSPEPGKLRDALRLAITAATWGGELYHLGVAVSGSRDDGDAHDHLRVLVWSRRRAGWAERRRGWDGVEAILMEKLATIVAALGGRRVHALRGDGDFCCDFRIDGLECAGELRDDRSEVSWRPDAAALVAGVAGGA